MDLNVVYFILSSCESQWDMSAHFVYNVDQSVKCPISRPRADVHKVKLFWQGHKILRHFSHGLAVY